MFRRLRRPQSDSSKPASLVETEQPSPERHGRPRVLVVDDDEGVRGFVRHVLEPSGLDVELAAHGGEALARLHDESAQFDLVVLDLVLPWVNGLQVLAAMRSHPRTQDIPVVIITGTMMTRHEFSGEKKVALLRKPFEPDHLVSAVRLMLHGGDGT